MRRAGIPLTKVFILKWVNEIHIYFVIELGVYFALIVVFFKLMVLWLNNLVSKIQILK